MSQFFMRRPNLDDLPELPPLPPGYILTELRETELEPVAVLLQTAFEDELWTTERVHREFVAAAEVKKTFVIECEGRPVACASAQIPDKSPRPACLHWVAGDPTHAGKRLGYIASLAVLDEFTRHELPTSRSPHR